jgi:hypothetical protein
MPALDRDKLGDRGLQRCRDFLAGHVHGVLVARTSEQTSPDTLADEQRTRATFRPIRTATSLPVHLEQNRFSLS